MFLDTFPSVNSHVVAVGVRSRGSDVSPENIWCFKVQFAAAFFFSNINVPPSERTSYTYTLFKDVFPANDPMWLQVIVTEKQLQ